MFIVDYFGWIGTALLVISGLPMLWKTVKDGHAEGVSLLFLLAWFSGLSCMFIFSFLKMKGLILLLNYGISVIVVGIILCYKFKPRKPSQDIRGDLND